MPTISADGRFVTFYGYNSDFVGSGGFRGATTSTRSTFRPPPFRTSPSMLDRRGRRQPDTFSFSSTNNTATFECSLVQVGEPDEFTACTSPTPPTDLDDGDYVFKVRASAANLTSEPASRSFSVDTTGPSVSLEGGPAAVTNDNTPTLPFSAEPGTTFTCSLTRTDDDFQPCTSPITYPPQADGAVTFKVLGTDALGNVGPLTQYTFTIDASPASTIIVTAPAELTDDDTPTFEFESETDATFECRISLGVHPFTPCTSPVTYGPLPDDTYTFAVRTTDAAGNVGPTLTHTFTIDTVDAVPAPSAPDLVASSDTGTSNTDNLTSDNTPTFIGSALAGHGGLHRGRRCCRTEACSATSGGTYTVTTSALTEGPHTITARASDSTTTSEPSGPLDVQITAPPTACESATNTITGTRHRHPERGAARRPHPRPRWQRHPRWPHQQRLRDGWDRERPAARRSWERRARR